MKNFIRNLKNLAANLNYLWIADVEREVMDAHVRIQNESVVVHHHTRQINDLTNEVDEQDTRLDLVYEGLGGKVWRTQAGHARFLALLSTEHLRNILLWPSTLAKTMHLVNRELDRRRIDDEFRAKEQKTQAAATRVRKAVRKSKTKGKAK